MFIIIIIFFLYLRYAGINYVSVANNHLVDRHDNGIRSTMKLLKKYGIEFAGVASLKVCTPYVQRDSPERQTI